MDTQRGALLMVKVTKLILRVLATLLVGATFAVLGFILGANLFIILGLELFGALIGLIGSGALLFRRRTAK